jgi:ATP-dependent RNA helicase DBP3
LVLLLETHCTLTATWPPVQILKLVKGFSTPTPIQAQCWPLALGGHDVIGIAETGSGKTLGFVLPALRMILQRRPNPRQSGERNPLVLVLAPTRELASQIHQVCEQAEGCCGVRSALVYGGVPTGPQVKKLRDGIDVLVATPGRLLGLCRSKAAKLGDVCYMVLDEADRMLDLGFEPDVRAIMGQTASPRQTLLFSATWPDGVRKLGMDFVTRPIKVTIGDDDELTANKRIKQIVDVVGGGRGGCVCVCVGVCVCVCVCAVVLVNPGCVL